MEPEVEFRFNLMERSLMSLQTYLVKRAAKYIYKTSISLGLGSARPSTVKANHIDSDEKRIYFNFDDKLWMIRVWHIEHQVIASPRGPLGFLIGHVSVYEESDD
jgi:hypothetical protein